jgi:hypothetical protein
MRLAALPALSPATVDLFVPNERLRLAFDGCPSYLRILAAAVAGTCVGTLLYFSAVRCAGPVRDLPRQVA